MGKNYANKTKIATMYSCPTTMNRNHITRKRIRHFRKCITCTPIQIHIKIQNTGHTIDIISETKWLYQRILGSSGSSKEKAFNVLATHLRAMQHQGTTQVNVPHRNPNQADQYLIYLPHRDGRLS